MTGVAARRMVLNLLGVLAVALSNFIMVANGAEAERIDATPAQVVTGVLLSLASQFVGASYAAAAWSAHMLCLRSPTAGARPISCRHRAGCET